MPGCAILVSLLLGLDMLEADDRPNAARAKTSAPPGLVAPAQGDGLTLIPMTLEAWQTREAARIHEREHYKVRIAGVNKFLYVKPKQASPPPAEQDDDAPPPVPIRAVLDFKAMAISSQTFDEWIFEKHNVHGFVQARRPNLKTVLKEKAEEARSNLHLDETQYQKLLTAGSGDIQRFLNRVEEKRTDFEAVRQDYRAGLTFLLALEPLTAEAKAGPFGPDSLFAKTLHTMTETTHR